MFLEEHDISKFGSHVMPLDGALLITSGKGLDKHLIGSTNLVLRFTKKTNVEKKNKNSRKRHKRRGKQIEINNYTRIKKKGENRGTKENKSWERK